MKGGRHIFDSTRRVWSKRSTVCQPMPSTMACRYSRIIATLWWVKEEWMVSVLPVYISWARRPRGHHSNLSQSERRHEATGFRYTTSAWLCWHGSSEHNASVTAELLLCRLVASQSITHLSSQFSHGWTFLVCSFRCPQLFSPASRTSAVTHACPDSGLPKTTNFGPFPVSFTYGILQSGYSTASFSQFGP